VGRRLSDVDRDSHGKATLKPNQEIPTSGKAEKSEAIYRYVSEREK